MNKENNYPKKRNGEVENNQRLRDLSREEKIASQSQSSNDELLPSAPVDQQTETKRFLYTMLKYPLMSDSSLADSELKENEVTTTPSETVEETQSSDTELSREERRRIRREKRKQEGFDLTPMASPLIDDSDDDPEESNS